MAMVIRRATSADMPGLVKLLYQVEAVHQKGRPDLFREGARKYTDAELERIVADDERPVFVAVDEGAPEGEVLGYAFCVYEVYDGDNSRCDMRTLYIDDLCVDEACRGRHVGTAIYEHVLDFARSEGFYNVTLNVWSCNPSALAFYEARGLKPYKVGMEKIL